MTTEITNPTELRERFCQGDRQAVKDVFYQYYPMLCQTIFRIVADRHLAEDLAQEVFIKCWRKRNELFINSSLPAYLRRMAIREALYHLRRRKPTTLVQLEHCNSLSSDIDPLQQYYRNELRQRIDQVVGALPQRCKQAFQLSREQGLSYREIAEQLAIKPKTVENHIGRALQVLKRELVIG